MKKGNTIVAAIETDLDLTNANRISVTFSQGGKIKLIKSGSQVETGDHEVYVNILEEETYLFESGRFIPVEIEAFYDQGSATSNAMYRGFDGTIKSQNADVLKIEWDIAEELDRINGEVV